MQHFFLSTEPLRLQHWTRYKTYDALEALFAAGAAACEALLLGAVNDGGHEEEVCPAFSGVVWPWNDERCHLYLGRGYAWAGPNGQWSRLRPPRCPPDLLAAITSSGGQLKVQR